MKAVFFFWILAGFVVLSVGGCGDSYYDDELPSPTTTPTTVHLPAEAVMNDPIHVWFRCNGTTGVYARDNGLAVLADDPKCLR